MKNRKRSRAKSKTVVSPKPLRVEEWVRLVEHLIAKHSSRRAHVLVRRGRYKGWHKTTDELAWVTELARILQKHIRARNAGRAYDGNMALAALMGLVLAAWYAQVHRAKGFDPGRPLSRRAVFQRLDQFRARLVSAITDERIMGVVWGRQQYWNFPFGKGACGGEFI